MTSTFVLNGPVEVGLRALVLLVESSPRPLDLQQLVTFDYFLIHSGDLEDGPQSLHPPSPLRSGEVAVRRGLLAEGLNLYRFRGLIEEIPDESGFIFSAGEHAGAFLDTLRSEYVGQLRTCAEWVLSRYASLGYEELREALDVGLSRWKTEFVVLLPEDDAQ